MLIFSIILILYIVLSFEVYRYTNRVNYKMILIFDHLPKADGVARCWAEGMASQQKKQEVGLIITPTSVAPSFAAGA